MRTQRGEKTETLVVSSHRSKSKEVYTPPKSKKKKKNFRQKVKKTNKKRKEKLVPRGRKSSVKTLGRWEEWGPGKKKGSTGKSPLKVDEKKNVLTRGGKLK